jgi:putative transposase
VWQGRFKAFPIEEDEHLRVVLRYIEGNPLRAGLVESAQQWPWSSLAAISAGQAEPLLDPGPAPRGSDWVEAVNAPMFETDLQAIRQCVQRNAPFGCEPWVLQTASNLGLQSSLKQRATLNWDDDHRLVLKKRILPMFSSSL